MTQISDYNTLYQLYRKNNVKSTKLGKSLIVGARSGSLIDHPRFTFYITRLDEFSHDEEEILLEREAEDCLIELIFLDVGEIRNSINIVFGK